MNQLSLLSRVIPNVVSLKVGRAVLHTQAQSPHILFGAGVVGFIGTTILASRATLRVDEILTKTQTNLSNARMVYEDKEIAEKYDYRDDDYLKDRIYIYTHAFIDIAKLYGPTVVVGLLSVAALTKSHTIMNTRVAGLTAAYAGLEHSYREYRRRIEESFGKEQELDIYQGRTRSTVTLEEGDDGNKVEVHVTNHARTSFSPYARFFDEYSSEWNKVAEYNWLFLRAQQSYANDILRSRGHLFLNEVYDMLGLERSREGAVVGWVISKDGDNFVDFGFMDQYNEQARKFVNGLERSIRLDFNVDGIIYDKI